MQGEELTNTFPGSSAPGASDVDYEATRFFSAPTEAVFDALATTSGLAGSWAKVSGSISTGGELTFFLGDARKVIRVDYADRPWSVRRTVLLSEPPPDSGKTIAFEVSPEEAAAHACTSGTED